jgi:hypothetical protein
VVLARDDHGPWPASTCPGPEQGRDEPASRRRWSVAGGLDDTAGRRLCQRAWRLHPAGLVEPEAARGDLRAGRQDDRPVHGVLQFADGAGPGVLAPPGQGRGADPVTESRAPALHPGEVLLEHCHQLRGEVDHAFLVGLGGFDPHEIPRALHTHRPLPEIEVAGLQSEGLTGSQPHLGEHREQSRVRSLLRGGVEEGVTLVLPHRSDALRVREQDGERRLHQPHAVLRVSRAAFPTSTFISCSLERAA